MSKWINTNTSWQLNKKLVLAFGCDFVKAIVLSEITQYWNGKNRISFDGKEWVEIPNNEIYENLLISQTLLSRIVKELEKEGWIETKRIGVPSVKHYRLLPKII